MKSAVIYIAAVAFVPVLLGIYVVLIVLVSLSLVSLVSLSFSQASEKLQIQLQLEAV